MTSPSLPTPTGFEQMLDELRHNRIHSLHLGVDNEPIGLEGAKQLASALWGNTSLRSLTLVQQELGDEGMEAITAALKRQHRLESLTVEDPTLGYRGIGALARFLEISRHLAQINVIFHHLPPQHEHELSEAVRKSRNINYVRSCGQTNTSMSVSAANNIAAIHGFGVRLSRDGADKTVIRELYRRRPALVYYPLIRSDYEHALAEAALPPPDGKNLWQDLLVPAGKKGIPPLDNPELFSSSTQLDTLLARADFTPDKLQLTSPSGSTLLEAMCLSLPAADVIDRLNRCNFALGKEYFLRNDGKASTLLDVLIEKGEASALFSRANLHALTAEDARRIHRLLPSPQQEQVFIAAACAFCRSNGVTALSR